MNSQATSLYTDPEEDENKSNFSISNVSFNLELSEEYLKSSKLFNQNHEFPSINSSSYSSNSSQMTQELISKNKEIQLAIRLGITNLKQASEKIVKIDSDDDFNDIIEEIKNSEKMKNQMRGISELRTLETEENFELLQEIITNIKSLNNNLNEAKNNLGEDLTDLQRVEKENEELREQLNKITAKICDSLEIEASDNSGEVSCKCEII